MQIETSEVKVAEIMERLENGGKDWADSPNQENRVIAQTYNNDVLSARDTEG